MDPVLFGPNGTAPLSILSTQTKKRQAGSNGLWPRENCTIISEISGVNIYIVVEARKVFCD